MKTKAHHRQAHRAPSSMSDLWALMSVVAFPVTMFVAGSFGANWSMAFASGFLGVLAVLTANAIAEHRLWMFDPKWRMRFEHPEFTFKLAVVTGAILLILETTLLVIFFTDGSLDSSLVNLVFSRQCQNPSPAFQQVCDLLSGYFVY